MALGDSWWDRRRRFRAAGRHLSCGRHLSADRPQTARLVFLAAMTASGLAGCSAPRSVASAPVPTTKAPPVALHPFGRLSCRARYGVRLCLGGQVGHRDLRIPSFDGVPLDADVALPPSGTGPFPLIVMLHGLGSSKTEWETRRDDGLIDDVTFAHMGYAVLMYTARGFGDSCGTRRSRVDTLACAKGYTHFADQRYEIHDTQYLAGLLVDEGLARPDIAVTGLSYGAGQSLELAMLKNRVMETDGSLVPWRSPRLHIPMAVAAVYADWPWDDLATALDPNGQLLTNTDTPSADDISPAGVEKESWDTLLYSTSESSFLAPPGTDPTANVSAWFGAISAGEPYGSEVEAALSQLQQYHSAVGVPMPAGGPAPTALQNGWTDTLFPVSEGLHYAARLQAAGERTPLLMIFDDNGHGWAQDKPADSLVQTAKAIAFLNAIMLRHSTPPTGVVAIATTCPRTAPSEPRLSGPTFASLQAGSVSLGSAAPQIVTSSGGSASVARALDPADVSPLCQELPGKREPGTALYRLTMTRSATLLGGLVVHAELHVSGDFPELVGRLWDLDPRDGKRQLIEAGDLRPSFDEEAGATRRSSASGSVVFELPPNFYTVAAGHILELELVGSTAPWFRASNGRFRITVTGLTATIALARTSR